jgi:hypothetical protein
MDKKTDEKAKIRELMRRADPAMLAFCDMARDRFDAKLIGLAIQTELGLAGAGELGPKTSQPENSK